MKDYSSIVYNTEKLEVARCPFNWWVYTVEYYSVQKGKFSETCSNLDDLKKTVLKEARYKRLHIVMRNYKYD